MAYIEVMVQTLLAFSAILFYTRLLGKQQVGQLTFFEYVNGITFGSIAAVLATDVEPSRSLYHFLGLTLFAALTYLAGFVSLRSRKLRKIIAGEATIVIHNGKILEENMKKMHYNIDELLMQLREKDVFDLQNIEYAVLEPDGSLSVDLKSQAKPVTRRDMGISTEYEGLPVEVVMDGAIIHQNLQQVGLDEQWLRGELQKRGVKDINEVDLAVLSSRGDLFVDFSQDDLQSVTDISDNPEPSQKNKNK